MPVAEKYRAVRNFKFAGLAFNRGDSIEREFILAKTDASKLGTLQRTGFIELDPVTRPLDKMTKADLIEYGREVGASVDQRMTKADLLDAIRQEL